MSSVVFHPFISFRPKLSNDWTAAALLILELQLAASLAKGRVLRIFCFFGGVPLYAISKAKYVCAFLSFFFSFLQTRFVLP